MLGTNMWLDEHGNTCIGIKPEHKQEPKHEPTQKEITEQKETTETKKEEAIKDDCKKTVKRGRRKRP